MHEHMARIYTAASKTGRLDEDHRQASLARLLNVSVQNVNNWESRGPSKEGLLQAQEFLGINATWVLTGQGPLLIEGYDIGKSVKWPFRKIYPQQLFTLSDEELNEIEEDLTYLIGKISRRKG